MSAIEQLKGIYAPIVTPCDAAERMDEERFAANAERLLSEGLQGLYVCGGTGDAGKLTVEERKQACRIAAEIVRAKAKRMIVHVGSTSERVSVELARHAAEHGADAVSAIPPSGLAPNLLRQYYAALARASGLPVIIYHIPAVTGYQFTFDQLIELLSIPGVAGIKMTDWNLFLMNRITMEKPDAVVYNGYDEMMVPGLLYGAGGCIGTWVNLFPEMYVQADGLLKAGRVQEAMRIQSAFLHFLAFAWKHNVIAVFEALMRNRGYAQVCFRKPFEALPADRAEPIVAEAERRIAVLQRTAAEILATVKQEGQP
jgi:N-acetylneuraminate lyase